MVELWGIEDKLFKPQKFLVVMTADPGKKAWKISGVVQ